MSSLPLIAAVAASLSTDTIVVGHPALRPSFRVGADTTDVWVTRDGNRQKISTGTETISATSDGYLIVHANSGQRGISIDSITVSAGLRPLRHVEAQADRQATFAFVDGQLEGVVVDSAGRRSVRRALGRQLLDFSTIGRVTRALPLTAGYEAVILTFDVFSEKERSVRFKVVGREPVASNGVMVDAWRTETDFPTHRVVAWADARSGRQIRWEIEMPGMKMEGIARSH